MFNILLLNVGASLQFITEVFRTCLNEQSIDYLITLMRKTGIDDKLLDFFPPNKRQEEYFARHFESEGLKVIVDFYKKKQGNLVKDEIKGKLIELIQSQKNQAEVCRRTKFISYFRLDSH